MDKDVLGMVISVEKEIQASLEAEKVRAAGWLEGIKESSAEEFAREEALIMEGFQKSAATAMDAATAKAEAIIRDAEEEAGKLLSLSDGTLTEIIMKRISRVLPE